MEKQRDFFPQKVQQTERVLGKKMPSSLEAENAVLGALLLNDENITHVSEILASQDFYVPAHRLIYQAVLDIALQAQRVDLVTLQDHLETKGQLETVGGVIYLLGLQDDIPSLGLISQHAGIIKEKAVLRELIVRYKEEAEL